MAASLKLILTDVAGQDLNDSVVVDLFAIVGSGHYQASGQVRRELVITGIDVGTGPAYRVMVTPANHRVIQFFVMLADGQTVDHTEAIPVDPDKVAGITAPDYGGLLPGERSVLAAAQAPRFNDGRGGYLQADALYTALDRYPLLKACLLNIGAKSAATQLPDGSFCLDHCQGLIRIEQDRIFVRTTAALREEVQHSRLFHSVSTEAHDPVPGYRILDSYKTFDRYGNLQLTFQRQGNTGNDYVADVDIDDAQGVGHIWQVVRNEVTGPTNPYDIHEILIAKQNIDPHYSFEFARAAAV